MKLGHRLGLLGITLLIVGAAVYFYLRADGEAQSAAARWAKLERATAAAQGEARLRLRDDAQMAREDEDNALTQRAFWVMAGCFGLVLLLLAVVFQVLERRHARRTDALIASFGVEPGEEEERGPG